MGTPSSEEFAAMNPGYKPLKKLPKCVKAPMETLLPKETLFALTVPAPSTPVWVAIVFPPTLSVPGILFT